MPTKKQFSDSVLFKLSGGWPDGSLPVDERDIWAALERKINNKLKLDQFSMNLPSGGTIPDNLMLATYQDVEVTRTFNEKSKCTLPVMPISLPRNAGINEIRPVINLTDSGDRMLSKPLVPLQAGQSYLLDADKLLNDLMGNWGYEVSGRTIQITKDLTTYGITKVDMKLVVFDISLYGVTDTLPVPSDWFAILEEELLREFAPVSPETGIVNAYTNIGQTPIPNPTILEK